MPIRLFRDLLSLSQPPDKRKAAAVREQIDTVAGLSPYEVVAELSGQVVPEIGKQENLHMRFKLLEDARLEAEKALPVLERHIDYSSLPLPLAATTSALSADNLMKGLASGYTSIARAIASGSRQRDLGHLFVRAIQRAMAMLARRQYLAYRSYAKPSSSSWLMLHELYQLARNHRDHAPNDDISSIEQQYLGALLLAYLEPGKLPRAELASAVFCTQQLAVHATIGDVTPETNTQPSTTPLFLVHPGEGSAGTPLYRMPKGMPIFEGLIIDCGNVMAVLDRSLDRSPENPGEGGLDIPSSLLYTIQVAIGGRSTRRFARKRFKPRANVVGGLAEVIPFLEGDAQTRRAGEAARRRGPERSAPSEWSLVDQSPDGFLVRFIQGEKWNTGIGNVVAVQPRESSIVHVCLIRRIATDSKGRLELGLQVLSPQVSVVDLPAHGEIRRGLYLHHLPAYGGRPGVIARPGQLASGHKIRLAMPGGTTEVQVGRRIESSDALEFFAVIPAAV